MFPPGCDFFFSKWLLPIRFNTRVWGAQRMSFRYSLFFMVVVGLAGCATVPSLPPRYVVNAADVLDAVECQLKDAVTRQFPDHKWLKSWAAQMTLTLEVN